MRKNWFLANKNPPSKRIGCAILLSKRLSKEKVRFLQAFFQFFNFLIFFFEVFFEVFFSSCFDQEKVWFNQEVSSQVSTGMFHVISFPSNSVVFYMFTIQLNGV